MNTRLLWASFSSTESQLHSSKAPRGKRLELEGRFVVKWGKANALVWSGVVWSPSHLDPCHNFIPSHHTPSHPSNLLTLFPIILHPSCSILPCPIPLHPMAFHPSHFTYPISPCFLFFLSYPTLFHPTLSHPMTPLLFHSPCPPTYLFPPMPSHLFHCPPPHPHLLWTSMPSIPTRSCCCQGHGPIGGGGHLEQFHIQDVSVKAETQ